MIKDNEQENKVLPTEKWNFCHSVQPRKILIINSHAPLCHMTQKTVKYVSKNNKKFQFQVECMYLTTLKQSKAFNEQVEKVMLRPLML